MDLMVWFQNVPDHPGLVIQARKRGGPVFDLLAKRPDLVLGGKVFLADGENFPIPTAKWAAQSVVFSPLQPLVDAPGLAEDLFARGCRVIVDVQFPLAHPGHIMSIQDVPAGERDVALDEAARAHWSDPARVERAYWVLRQADAVTVGPRGTFSREEARRYPDWVLPDMDDPASAAQFYRQFMSCLFELTSPATGLSRWWKRWVFRGWLRLAAGEVARGVEIVP